MLHRGLFTDSEKEMRFPSCNFCLKKRLGEPAQFKTRLQFGRALQLVRTNLWLSFAHKELESWENLLGLWQVSLKHDLAMSRQRGVTVQNKQGWVYQGHNWPNGTNATGWHDQVPFWWAKRAEGFTIWFKRVQCGSKVITHSILALRV
jgi:hypothetical protein